MKTAYSHLSSQPFVENQNEYTTNAMLISLNDKYLKQEKERE